MKSLVPILTVACLALVAGTALGEAQQEVLTVEQMQELVAGDAAEFDRFGRSVSVDGDSAVIGAPLDDDFGTYSGSAYVFTLEDGLWTQQAKLLPHDAAPYDFFGGSVSMSGDTVVVSASEDDDTGVNSGSAYVFTRTGNQWTEEGKLLAGDGTPGSFIGRPSISINRDTVVVSAPLDDDNGTDAGAAYVFARTDGVWAQQAKLLADDGAPGDSFGTSVSVDGNTVVVGSPSDDDNGDFSGSAYVYSRTDGAWAQQAKLIAEDAALHQSFGRAVAVNGDTTLISAPRDDENGLASGSAYVFTRSDGVWTQQAKLLADDGTFGDGFGGSWSSVSVEGDTAAIGAGGDDDNGPNSGSVYVFTRVDGVWSQQAELLADDGADSDWFGVSVSMDGDLIVIGAWLHDHTAEQSGSAYVFRLIPPDADGDGIDDQLDICPNTVLPESVPTRHLGVNRWALVGEDPVFDTNSPPGGGDGPDFEFTLEDTGGCACEQIIEAAGHGRGHTKFGCGTRAMVQWVSFVAP